MSTIGATLMWIAIGIVGLFVLLWFFPITLWFQALISGVRINLIQLVLMRWRKVPPSTIVMAMVTGTKAGLHLDVNALEAHYLAKGNVGKVVNALISADKANIPLDFKMAAAIDLAGRDVFEAVQMSVNPKVINTPPVSAVAKDGIQLIAKARVTVRASIKQLVGGAGEETVLARVGEGIVSSIGSAESHKAVLENPDFISKVVLEKGLDSGTAFERSFPLTLPTLTLARTSEPSCKWTRPTRTEHCPGPRRRTPCHGRCRRTGNESQSPGSPCQSHSCRGRDTPGHGRSIPQRQPRHHGLLPHEEHPGRYRHARQIAK